MDATDDGLDREKYDLAQDSREIFDVYPPPPSPSRRDRVVDPSWGSAYHPSPVPTGRTKSRRRVHEEGDWHRSVQVWLVQKPSAEMGAPRVLLQRRSEYKGTHPDLLDVSCAGHVDSGEDVAECALRELREELGGAGAMMLRYTLDDLERAKAFVVASSVEGTTRQFGSFVCNEYQDVFILWFDENIAMEKEMFAPMNSVEVSGFEIVDGAELISRMRRGDGELVPRSAEYVNALARAIGVE